MAISTPATLGTAATVANSTTQTFNTTATVPSGGKIWVVVGWFDGTATLSSITGGSLTWTIDIQGKNGSVGRAICQADAPAGLASGTTITANFSSGTADRFMSGAYATGVATGASSDYGAVSQNQSVAGWSSTTTTVSAGDVLIGGSHTSQASGSPTSTAGGGNTELDDITTADGDSTTTTYQMGTGAAIAASGTWTGSGFTNRSSAVAYMAAAGSFMPGPERVVLQAVNRSSVY